MSYQVSCGIDIGRSSIKAVGRNETGKLVQLNIPSAVCSAYALTEDAKRAEADTVTVNGKSYFVGETAMIQGKNDLAVGLDDNWALSDMHAALLIAAIKKFEVNGLAGAGDGVIVVGLPAKVYSAQRAAYSALINKHFDKAKVRVVPQPLGPFFDLIFDENGLEKTDKSAQEQSCAIIEIGQFTTDFALIRDGRPVESGFGTTEGMLIAIKALARELQQKGFSKNLAESTVIIEKGNFRNYGQIIDATTEIQASVKELQEVIMINAKQTFGSIISSLDNVIVAGGGAPLIYPMIKAEWPHAVLAENPRFSVANGFSKFATAISKQ